MSVEKLNPAEEAAFKAEVVDDLTKNLINEQIDLGSAIDEVICINARIYELNEDGEFDMGSDNDQLEEVTELMARLDAATGQVLSANAELKRLQQRIAYIEAN